MVAMKSDPWIGRSRDGVALIFTDKAGQYSTEPAIASIEIKTTVAASRLDKSLSHSSEQVKNCVFGDNLSVQIIPKVHIGELLQKPFGLDIDYVVYVSTRDLFKWINSGICLSNMSDN